MRIGPSATSLALATVTAWPALVAAQSSAESSPPAFSGNLGLVSEYRYRGIAQTNGRPAVQAGLDYAHASGLYLGSWASNVSWLSDTGAGVSNSLEWDLYGGYKRTLGEIGYELGLLRYVYPGSYPAGFTSPDTTELYVAGSWRMLTLKYSHSLGNLFGFVDSRGAGYLDLSGNFDLGGAYSLLAHVGHQAVPAGSVAGLQVRTASDCSYTDWKLALTRQWAGLNWGLSWLDTNARGGVGQCYRSALNRDLGKGSLLLSVGTTF